MALSRSRSFIKSVVTLSGPGAFLRFAAFAYVRSSAKWYCSSTVFVGLRLYAEAKGTELCLDAWRCQKRVTRISKGRLML